ncbi:extracellular solute-binding protein [Bacillus sp. OTU530]|uniref:extracellular solute-binding protein n=1 Tax=Bacillus sp. OTU530 TaxID=3043862 RepID=UPI00313EDBE6
MRRGFWVKSYPFIVIAIVSLLVGGAINSFFLYNDVKMKDKPNKKLATPLFFEKEVKDLPEIQEPEGFDWRQFDGVTINMITENTPPSIALAANIWRFEAVTGIKINMELDNLGTVIEKTGLDMNAAAAKYQIIYADPYQILPQYDKGFVDLHKFNDDPKLPHVPGGLGDFIQNQLNVVSYMGNKDKLLTLPYDASTMLLAYRKDVFEKYKDSFMAEHGYDWTPGPNLSWDQYYEIGKWINEKAANGTITEVKYGIGHQAKRGDSLMNDFSNILAANGGDYVEMSNIEQGKSDAVLQSVRFYRKLIKIAAPESISWDWTQLADAFANGDLAMAPEWHDFSALFEDKTKSNVSGKVGWAILPKGKKGYANSFGGTGLAINKYASEKEQKAAWLFLIWATAPQTQYMLLQSTTGGSTPTRYSVYALPDIQKDLQDGTPDSKKLPNLLPMKAAFEAWKDENTYVRPKIPQWQQANMLIFTELSKMLLNKQTPEETVRSIARKSNEALGKNE